MFAVSKPVTALIHGEKLKRKRESKMKIREPLKQKIDFIGKEIKAWENYLSEYRQKYGIIVMDTYLYKSVELKISILKFKLAIFKEILNIFNFKLLRFPFQRLYVYTSQRFNVYTFQLLTII